MLLWITSTTIQAQQQPHHHFLEPLLASSSSQPPFTVPPTGNQKHCLPESYGNVPPVSLTATTVSVLITNQLSSLEGNLDPAIAQENAWLEHGQQKLQGTLTSTDKIPCQHIIQLYVKIVNSIPLQQ